MEYINLLTSLPSVSRPLDLRKLISNADRRFHWELGHEYFDGTRDQGYGGYKDDGRWEPVAKDFISHYNLDNNSNILEIGCAKGYLLNSFIESLNNKENWGVDISSYALNCAPLSVKEKLVIANAKDLPFEDNSFDLVISINSLHNLLNINDTIDALREIERVSSRNSYITVAAYKNKAEKKLIDDWAVVATTYMHEDEWIELFDLSGYTGDYYWFKPNISFGK